MRSRILDLLAKVRPDDREKYAELVSEARFLGRDDKGLEHIFLFPEFEIARRTLDPDRALFVLKSQVRWLEKGQMLTAPGSLAEVAYNLFTMERVLQLLPPKTQEALKRARDEMAVAYNVTLEQMRERGDRDG